MSIYATLHEIGIVRFGDTAPILIYVQGVPAHIDYTGPGWEWLPPPVPEAGEDDDGPPPLRAMVFVEAGESKGTARCGQEYVRPLLILSGAEYASATFADLLRRLEDALDERYGPRPGAVLIDEKGKQRRIFPPKEGSHEDPS